MIYTPTENDLRALLKCTLLTRDQIRTDAYIARTKTRLLSTMMRNGPMLWHLRWIKIERWIRMLSWAVCGKRYA